MAQYQSFYFEEGSAARRLTSGVLQTREEYVREIQELKDRKKRERIRAHRLAKLQNRRATFLFALGVALTGVFFVSYVDVQNQIATSMNHISKLEKEISELKTANAAAKSRISTTANLAKIQKTAIKDLGMVYANSSQIVYYSVDDEDFMSQYEEIR